MKFQVNVQSKNIGPSLGKGKSSNGTKCGPGEVATGRFCTGPTGSVGDSGVPGVEARTDYRGC